MSVDSYCSLALPRGVMGWSAVCDCGISRLYPLTFLTVVAGMFKNREFSLLKVFFQSYYRDINGSARLVEHNCCCSVLVFQQQ